ncbi:MAG TPA: sugar porter family MFS transporter [Steroidobacteraceae bacterium]|jgi:sugar porter (SP) family MFS transporter|nr:sugar porter family MFS transporter [Steroidobacteraceae bacterium]
MRASEALNGTLLRSVAVAALGGSLLGFDTAVISGATQSLTDTFALTPGELGITVSAALWGTVVGAIGAGPFGRRLGARTSLLILAACYMVSAIGCAVSPSWTLLLVARFIGGLGMGGSSVIAPVYIAEVAPSAWRGRLVGAFQVNIIVGILLAYFSNYVIGLFSPGALEWRWELGIAAIPAAIFLVTLLGNPPSARWLAMQGRRQEARETLRKLGSRDPDAELALILASVDEPRSAEADRLFQWRHRRPITLAILLAMFNQLIGINAVLYYLNDIFAMAGFSRTSQNLQAVAVGAVMLVATLLALSLIDRFGRRTLLLVGSVGLAVCLAGIAGIFHTHAYEQLLLLFVIGYVGFFAFSQGSVIFVYLSEIFPGRVRAQGQSLGCSTHWVMNALISAAFPVLAARSAAGPFIVFLVMVVLQFFAVLLFFPETSGVTLEDMHKRIGGEGTPGRYLEAVDKRT